VPSLQWGGEGTAGDESGMTGDTNEETNVKKRNEDWPETIFTNPGSSGLT
jgi:hypothetical protein